MINRKKNIRNQEEEYHDDDGKQKNIMENRRLLRCASSFFRNVASTSKVRSTASISIGYEAVALVLF